MVGDPGRGAEVIGAQRDVTRIALEAIHQSGFALAGSGAIREHGLISRPTEDVDLFTTIQHADRFEAAVEQVTQALRVGGYEVEPVRQFASFARLEVRALGGLQVDVDLGVDWRAEEPVRLDVGPVLSLDDAVGNKVAAVYSRGEARDFLDLDAIRASGRFSDPQLLEAAAERDLGFDLAMFAQQLDIAQRLTRAHVAAYGVNGPQLEALKERLAGWAAKLRTQGPDVEQPPDAARVARADQAFSPRPGGSHPSAQDDRPEGPSSS